MTYRNELRPIASTPPLLADCPRYVEPLLCERRFLAPPLVYDGDGALLVRSWRYWYNARGIIEMENRLDAGATAVIIVHPWGVDDGHGLETPQPAGCVFFCTPEKNRISLAHMREVVSPFLARLRDHVALIGYSLPGKEDPIRRLLYRSPRTKPEELDAEEGEKRLLDALRRHGAAGRPLIAGLELDPEAPVRSYLEQTPSPDAGPRYNGPDFWNLPMPVANAIGRGPRDVVFYDAEGYPAVRDHLKGAGVRHVLLGGYATDRCVRKTTCGYAHLSKDFNVFIVGDATLATFPASTTPRFATQAALAHAALEQMVTQVGWVTLDPPKPADAQ